jgi:hypothetical protein
MKKKILVVLLIVLALTSVVQLAMISHPKTVEAMIGSGCHGQSVYCCWTEAQNCNGGCPWHFVTVCMTIPCYMCEENNRFSQNWQN